MGGSWSGGSRSGGSPPGGSSGTSLAWAIHVKMSVRARSVVFTSTRLHQIAPVLRFYSSARQWNAIAKRRLAIAKLAAKMIGGAGEGPPRCAEVPHFRFGSPRFMMAIPHFVQIISANQILGRICARRRILPTHRTRTTSRTRHKTASPYKTTRQL
jgi:hypothetical protein